MQTSGYFGLMIRRVINAMYDGRLVDDRSSAPHEELLNPLAEPHYLKQGSTVLNSKLRVFVDMSVGQGDYYGNKRLELSGQLIEVLFEDCPNDQLLKRRNH